nr:hypothetical protein Iba_scaffold11108CG0010 [Ipomoea batatas]
MPPSPHVVSHHRRVVLLLRERMIAVAAWNHDPAPMSPPAAVAGTTPTPYVARYRSTPFMEFAIALLCCPKENKGGEKLRHAAALRLNRWMPLNMEQREAEEVELAVTAGIFPCFHNLLPCFDVGLLEHCCSRTAHTTLAIVNGRKGERLNGVP